MNLQAAIAVHQPEQKTKEWKHGCVDFDGVLAVHDGTYQPGKIGAPIPEGLRLLRMLLDQGYQVTILTARKETDLVARWLAAQGFPNMFVTNEKPPAQAYVDDRAVYWNPNANADEILKELKKRPL